MQINPHIFREFSIRGIANRDLSDEVVTRIGQAIGHYFRQRGKRTMVVGRDARISSERISESLIAGLLQAGMTLTDLGMVPTPVLNFSTDYYEAAGGVMITASHNPPDYNGLKIRSEQTLQGSQLQEIYTLAKSGRPLEGGRGSIRRVDPLPEYRRQVQRHAAWGDSSLKVVVDGGNGTNGLIVSSMLASLGCQVIELYCQPDGRFPNRKPDPTAAGATADLADSVLDNEAQLGLAYDGDGDRVVAVDDQGKTVLGDQLLMLLARDVLRRGPANIVYEILCTQALADDISAHGGRPVMTPSGYAFVHRAMQETGAVIGGELSGHFFCSEPGFRFDDAILATIKLLNILARERQPLSSLLATLPAYHSSPEIRLRCPDQAKAAVVERIRSNYRSQYKVEEIDGARIHFPEGWALVRQSNTQPVMSMRFEARSAEALVTIQTEVQSLVERFIKEEETQ